MILSPNSNKGFTLIELLVVIAIIGIISAIVVASLSSSRVNSIDTAIKQNLITIRSQAEIYFNTNDSYAPLQNALNCNSYLSSIFRADPVIYSAIGTISSINGGVSSVCKSNPTSWAVVAQLKSGGYWCVDYTGVSKPEGNNTINSILSQYSCP